MAEYTPPDDWLGNLSGAVKDAKDRYKSEEAIRKASKPKLLTPNDIITGKWDASRTLQTTLGGVLRNITADDLAAFKANQKTVADKYEKGITAQQVINHSLQVDRDRANKEIRMAVPSSFVNGTLRFITNAGGTTKGVHRHFVTVEFIKWGSESASSDKNARQSAFAIKKSPLKISCDCRRWRFWYTYLASIGGFNAGLNESAFPKVRNPNLSGVACKHILRVMHEVINGGSVVNFLTNHMEKSKAHDKNKAQTRNKQKEAEKLAKRQNKRTKSHELKVKESVEKKVAVEKAKAAAAKAKLNLPKKPKKPMTAQEFNSKLKLIKSLGLSDEDTAAMIAILQKSRGG